MAIGIYVASTTEFSGKNVVAIGLGLRFQREGLRVGYMKPVGISRVTDEGDSAAAGDADGMFAHRVLGLDEDPALVTPVFLDRSTLTSALTPPPADGLAAISSAYAALAKDKDLMIVSGTRGIHFGRTCGLDAASIAKVLSIRLLVIDRLQQDLNYDLLLILKDQLGDQLAGVLLNDIPANLHNDVETLYKPFLERNDLQVLGVIPRDPLMGGIKIGDLAQRLGGKVISAHAKIGKVVENFLIGTMHVDNFMTYFRKSKNAVIIMGGDRSDLQLVSMEGHCPCMILTGNLYPNDIILTRSEVQNIPIILVPEDTYSVAKKVEGILARQKLRDPLKTRQGAQLVSASVNFEAIKKCFGL